MHSVDRLEEALRHAARCGLEVRQEWLGEAAGGACRVGSKWILFVNLSLPADEQLSQVLGSLASLALLPKHSGDAQIAGI